ncbi:MAG: YeeE/YedE thiosulfate transporter family protein [Pseudomonadales bacterium]|nr:YeeE/YedE thiosulfate transporter family protein [Pseudomonadales bacterium]
MVTEFTPLASFGGGALIGLGTVMLMGGQGLIFGATSILSGLVFPETRPKFVLRAVLILGMVLAPGLIFILQGDWPVLQIPVTPLMIALGGIIAGLGASFASGCTSGHGVCGLSRFSARSLVAVPTFMASAALTVYLVRHVLGS